MPEMLTIKGLNVGMQFVSSDEDLTFCKQMGLEYVDASPRLRPSLREMGLLRELGLERESYWKADAQARRREQGESFGLELAALHMPLLTVDGERHRWASIALKPSERDRAIERVCQCIEAVGKAGIPTLNYWLNFMSAERSPGWTTGRGGIRYSNFDDEEMKNASPYPTWSSSAEQAWEWIE